MIFITRNVNIDTINDVIIIEFCDDIKTYFNVNNTFQNDDILNSNMSQKYLNIMNVSNMFLYNITFKINCFIILIYNLKYSIEFYNDIKIIVTKLKERMIEMMILIEFHVKKHAFIFQISLNTSISFNLSFIF